MYCTCVCIYSTVRQKWSQSILDLLYSEGTPAPSGVGEVEESTFFLLTVCLDGAWRCRELQAPPLVRQHGEGGVDRKG